MQQTTALQHVVRWLRSKNTTKYLETHPFARDALVVAVQEVTHPKLPPTPAPTPLDPAALSEHATTPCPAGLVEEHSPTTSPHNTYGEESSASLSYNLPQTPSEAADSLGGLVTEGDLEHGTQRDASSENIEILGDKGDVRGDVRGDVSANDDSPSSEAFADTAQRKPRKRKHVDEGSSGPEPISSDGADVAGDDLIDDCPESRHNSPLSGTSCAYVEGGDGIFLELSAVLRAKVDMIGNTATLVSIEAYVKYATTTPSSFEACIYGSADNMNPDAISASNQRLRTLKDCILRMEAAEKSVKHLRIAFRISKRVALAELVGQYIKERQTRTATPKKRRKGQSPSQLSLKNHFTNLLFPETIQTGRQGRENEMARKAAKRKVSYWISLGEPLARMAQRFGYGVLLLLPAKLTDKDLYHLPRPHIQLLLDYVDLVHPGLKEQACKLPHTPPIGLLLDELIFNLSPELTSKTKELLSRPASNSDKVDFETHDDNQLSCSKEQQQSSTGSSDSPDYYSEEVDWRAEPQPRDGTEHVAGFSVSDLPQSSANEEGLDWSSYIVFSP
ncbi:hypothetical protein BJ878DRAFT_483897 [Calycina marina]|uniref:Uncharacterized protein n=1 Tax=Calycina marina TaxID=1763456 RepID=A0A9P7YUT2_9HELO|nr:hypothetical protein BJ878DRAFT_483897 [Calycina marina]